MHPSLRRWSSSDSFVDPARSTWIFFEKGLARVSTLCRRTSRFLTTPASVPACFAGLLLVLAALHRSYR